jgi:hypothetical protein
MTEFAGSLEYAKARNRRSHCALFAIRGCCFFVFEVLFLNRSEY